jgi:hypothetical protein
VLDQAPGQSSVLRCTGAIALRRAMVLYSSPIDSLSAIIDGIIIMPSYPAMAQNRVLGKAFGPGRRRALWAGPHAPSLRLVCARRLGCRICTVLNRTGNLNLCGKFFDTPASAGTHLYVRPG